MANEFLTFQKFNDLELANEIAAQLTSAGIENYIENYQNFFDVSYANNKVDMDIHLKIRQPDFAKANLALDSLYARQLENIESDYYLFDFNNEELIEIINKPDEWGRVDYLLAQKLLKDRGVEIAPTELVKIKDDRLKSLAEPEPISRKWIFAGYLVSLLGGVIGIIMGVLLMSARKTLPDGNRVYVYNSTDRSHGKTMALLALIIFMISVAIRIFIAKQY